MGGVPLDVMDRLKNIFRRKKDKPVASNTTGTKTEVPKPSETAPAAPIPAQTPHDTTKAPSTSDPTAASAGAAPVNLSQSEQPPAAPTPSSNPVATATGGPTPQASEATSGAAPKAPTSTTV